MPKVTQTSVDMASSGLLEAVNSLLEADNEVGIDTPEAALKKIITSLVSPGTGNQRVVLYLEPQDLRTYGRPGGYKVLAELLVRERPNDVVGFFNNPYHKTNRTSFIQVFTGDFNLGALSAKLGQRAVLLDVPAGTVADLLRQGKSNQARQAEALVELLRHRYYVAAIAPGKITKNLPDPHSTDVDELEPNFNIEAVVGYVEPDVRQAALDAHRQQVKVKAQQKDHKASGAEPRPEDEDAPAYKFADEVDSYIANNLHGKMPTDEAGAKQLSAFIRRALDAASGNNLKVKRSILRPEVLNQIFHLPQRRHQIQLLAYGAIDEYLAVLKRPGGEGATATPVKPAAERPAERSTERPTEKPTERPTERPATSSNLIQQIIKTYDIKDADKVPEVLKALYKELQAHLKS